MPNSFSIQVTAPAGMNLGPAGRGAPVNPATQIERGVRTGVIFAVKFLRKKQRDDLAAQGRHNPLVTRSSAPIGGPPQMASGRLRNSVSNTTPERLGSGVWGSWIGPNATGSFDDVDKYSATQEYGRLIMAKSPKGMSFVYGRKQYRGLASVYVPARPFTKGIRSDEAGKHATKLFADGKKSVIGNQWYGNW
jgi:hypothetical protein